MKMYAFRLTPGQDLKQELLRYAAHYRIHAGFILTCVGSVQQVALRLADQDETTRCEGKFEIVSLVGTLNHEGAHLHLAIADTQGVVVGGHLMDGTRIYTTAEIVMGAAPDLRFTREHDPQTGYNELVVTEQQ
jgi:predicted DNA-binding protein with PD1-like motif